MILNYLMMDPENWIFPLVLQAIAYFFILRKMGLKKWTAIIPFLAEREMSTVLFRKMRSFYRPFIIAAVFVTGAYYLGPEEGTGAAYMCIAIVVYGLFLIRLYCRLAKSFGKGFIYTILMILFPTLFLLILGLGKSVYRPLEFKEERWHSRFYNQIRKLTVALISIAEVIILVLGVGFYTVRAYPPVPLVNYILNDTYAKTKDIVSDGNAVGRDEAMGEAAASLKDITPSREKMFPDHSKDKSVVVMEYIVGADLEDRMGMASANISMMKDATKKGDALTFVLEAGGSKRWFTGGIADSSYGRYDIKDGDLKKVMDLDNGTSLEESESLEDFIKWTAENYPADRYMLVLWDHGGGVPYGYARDQLNPRKPDNEDDERRGLSVSEVVDAVKKSGIRFDLIGFDACLMQDIEIARAFEPYADYYLGSEETEGGFGWYYTSSFGKLASDPGMSTEEFGKDIVAAYDQFNTILNDGEAKNSATLSLVDLTLVRPAYKKFNGLLEQADQAIKNDPADFGEVGLAAMNAYAFADNIQMDLVDFIEKLDDADVNDSICSQADKDDAINAVKACVIYRNRDSAKGINGMALALPYKSIDFYSDTAVEFDNLRLLKEKAVFNDIFSIIAVQKKAEHDNKEPSKSRLINFLDELQYEDYTQQEWYVKGFEDYYPTTTLVDIPLTDTGNGFSVQLPEKTWKIIADCVTIVYQKTEDGKMRYLGYDHTGDLDADGHPMVDMDDRWVHINGQLVCYEDKGAKETEDGTFFTGDVKARLNDADDILIHIEWNPSSDNAEGGETGRVTGYDLVEDEFAFMSKGTQKLNAGDKIDFLFDYYDEEGKLISTEPYGKSIYVRTMDKLDVADRELEDCDIEFLGRLTDAYQRELYTEVVEAHIGD